MIKINKQYFQNMKKQKHTEETEKVDDVILNTEATEPTKEEGEQTEKEIEPKEDELEISKQKCIDLADKNLRLMAEFDNYRKRTLKERSELIKTAGEKVFVDMITLVDDFDRALAAMESATDIVAVKEGVDLIYNKFISFMLQNGVKAIPTENEVFDTDLHEAITTFPVEDKDMKGKIIDCASKGYTMNEKVIRFSKVVVGE
jgi:molecular chaperone GrpE